MKKSISKKYITNKIMKEGVASSLGQMALDTGMATAVQTGMQVGMGAVINIGSSIANVFRNIKYDLRGCDKITNPDSRAMCKQRLQVKESQARVGELQKLLRQCAKQKDPNKCREQVTNRVNNEMERQQSLRTNQ